MPKQVFDVIDYFGPLILGAIFCLILLLLSLVMNWLFIRHTDDVTTFEKFGARMNMRIGPHRMSVVKRSLVNKFPEEENATTSI